MNCTGEGGSNPIDAMSIITLLVICFIALSTGTTIVASDLRVIMASKKTAFLIGWVSQFGFMPLMAFALARAFGFEPISAVGVVLIGMSPGGSTSNLFTLWAKGNVALSIAMSAASTICAFFMLPLLYLVYVRAGLGIDGASMQLPVLNLLIALFSIVIPVTIGALIRRYNTTKRIGRLYIYQWIEIAGGAIGGLFLVAAIVTGALDNPHLMVPTSYPREWGLAAMFQPLGCLFGLTAGHLCKLDPRDVRAVSLETGVQNYALIIALVNLSFTGCTHRLVSVFVLVSSLWYVISSVWLVLALRFGHARLYPKGDPASDGRAAKPEPKFVDASNAV